jgi:hypothetical protein
MQASGGDPRFGHNGSFARQGEEAYSGCWSLHSAALCSLCTHVYGPAPCQDSGCLSQGSCGIQGFHGEHQRFCCAHSMHCFAVLHIMRLDCALTGHTLPKSDSVLYVTHALEKPLRPSLQHFTLVKCAACCQNLFWLLCLCWLTACMTLI